MKLKMAVLALAAVGMVGVAHAESRISAIDGATTGPMATTAKLNFKVVVPKILFLRVGALGATVNNVTFTVGLTGALATLPVADAVYGGALPPAFTSSVADDEGASDGAITVGLWTNNGSSTLSCAGSALTSGTNTIALSNVTVANAGTGTLSHPGASLACTSGSRGAAGVNNLADTWTFAYAPTVLPAAGNYTTTVTYTASQP
jgi:hypothetical protein